jgi:proteasome lid subunit RPN8/RPN11
MMQSDVLLGRTFEQELRMKLNESVARGESPLETAAVLWGALVSVCIIQYDCFVQSDDRRVVTVSYAYIPKQVQHKAKFDLEQNDAFKDIPEGLVFIGIAHSHPESDPAPTSIDQHTHRVYSWPFPGFLTVMCSFKHSAGGEMTQAIELTPAGVKALTECKQSGFHDQHAAEGVHWQYSRRFHIVEHDKGEYIGQIEDGRQ